MARYDDLESCSDLSEAQANLAVTSPAELKELLARCAEIAKGGEGCARVFLVVARLARGDVPWLEGELRAELSPNGEERSDLALFADLGFGLREPIVPLTTLPVPFAELARAVELAPALVGPLSFRREERRLVIARNATDVSALPPPVHDDATVPPDDDRTSAAPTRPPVSMSGAAPSSNGHGAHSRPTQRVSLADIEELLAREAKSKL